MIDSVGNGVVGNGVVILIVGRLVGFASVGAAEGITVGAVVGRPVGDWVGENVSSASLGAAEGRTDGAGAGRLVGDWVGEASVDASGMSNIFGVIWPTSSTTSEPFELVEALLPPGLGSDFEPLLFEDFLDPLADVSHASASDFEPLLDSVGIHAGDDVGNIVPPQEQGTPFSSTYS